MPPSSLYSQLGQVWKICQTVRESLAERYLRSRDAVWTQWVTCLDKLRRSHDGSGVYCTCPAWKFQTRDTHQRECKHMRLVWQGFRDLQQQTETQPKVASAEDYSSDSHDSKDDGSGSESHETSDAGDESEAKDESGNEDESENEDESGNEDDSDTGSEVDSEHVKQRRKRPNLPLAPSLLLLVPYEKLKTVERQRAWLYSIKADGVRAYWDGHEMYTRTGRWVNYPYRDELPSGVELDGELWTGAPNENSLTMAVSAVTHNRAWSKIRFYAFDMPAHNGMFRGRYRALTRLSQHHGFDVLEHKRVPAKGVEYVLEKYVAQGHEGIVLRDPMGAYDRHTRAHRHSIKVKPTFYVVAKVNKLHHHTGPRKNPETRKVWVTVSAYMPSRKDQQVREPQALLPLRNPEPEAQKKQRTKRSHPLHTQGGPVTFRLRIENPQARRVGLLCLVAYSGVTRQGKPEFPTLYSCSDVC